MTPYDVLTAAHCVFDVASGVSYTGWTFEPGKVGRGRGDGAAGAGTGAGHGMKATEMLLVHWDRTANLRPCISSVASSGCLGSRQLLAASRERGAAVKTAAGVSCQRPVLRRMRMGRRTGPSHTNTSLSTAQSTHGEAKDDFSIMCRWLHLHACPQHVTRRAVWPRADLTSYEGQARPGSAPLCFSYSFYALKHFEHLALSSVTRAVGWTRMESTTLTLRSFACGARPPTTWASSTPVGR